MANELPPPTSREDRRYETLVEQGVFTPAVARWLAGLEGADSEGLTARTQPQSPGQLNYNKHTTRGGRSYPEGGIQPAYGTDGDHWKPNPEQVKMNEQGRAMARAAQAEREQRKRAAEQAVSGAFDSVDRQKEVDADWAEVEARIAQQNDE